MKFEGKAEERELGGGGEGAGGTKRKELESARGGSAEVRAHTDRCLRCESPLGSERH